MLDIMLNKDGDIDVSLLGDISITDSIRQAVLVRLRWIYNEWRLGPELGFPWFEEVFVKDPNTAQIRRLVRDVIIGVDGVTNAAVTSVRYDNAKRQAEIEYTCTVGEETFREEVILYG